MKNLQNSKHLTKNQGKDEAKHREALRSNQENVLEAIAIKQMM